MPLCGQQSSNQSSVVFHFWPLGLGDGAKALRRRRIGKKAQQKKRRRSDNRQSCGRQTRDVERPKHSLSGRIHIGRQNSKAIWSMIKVRVSMQNIFPSFQLKCTFVGVHSALRDMLSGSCPIGGGATMSDQICRWRLHYRRARRISWDDVNLPFDAFDL